MGMCWGNAHHTGGSLSFQQVAGALFQDFGTQEPEQSDVKNCCQQNADDEEDGKVLYPACGEVGDDHRGGGNEEERKDVLDG